MFLINENVEFYVKRGLKPRYAQYMIQKNRDVFSILSKHYIPGKKAVFKNSHFLMNRSYFEIVINITDQMARFVCKLNVEGDEGYQCESILRKPLSEFSMYRDRNYFLKLLDFMMAFNEPTTRDFFNVETIYTSDTTIGNLETFATKVNDYAADNSAFAISGSKPDEKPAIMYVLKPKFL